MHETNETTETTEHVQITYYQLRSGEWGLRGPASLQAGAEVTVCKRDGSTRVETVGRVVWSDSRYALATIDSGDPSRARRRYFARRGGSRTQSRATSATQSSESVREDQAGISKITF